MSGFFSSISFLLIQETRPKTVWAQVSCILCQNSCPCFCEWPLCANNQLIIRETKEGQRWVTNCNPSAESADIRWRKCLCLSAVAEKTTGAVGNIVAATGLGKKDEFPTDVNVRMLHTSLGSYQTQCTDTENHPQVKQLPGKSINELTFSIKHLHCFSLYSSCPANQLMIQRASQVAMSFFVQIFLHGDNGTTPYSHSLCLRASDWGRETLHTTSQEQLAACCCVHFCGNKHALLMNMHVVLTELPLDVSFVVIQSLSAQTHNLLSISLTAVKVVNLEKELSKPACVLPQKCFYWTQNWELKRAIEWLHCLKHSR